MSAYRKTHNHFYQSKSGTPFGTYAREETEAENHRVADAAYAKACIGAGGFSQRPPLPGEARRIWVSPVEGSL